MPKITKCWGYLGRNLIWFSLLSSAVGWGWREVPSPASNDGVGRQRQSTAGDEVEKWKDLSPSHSDGHVAEPIQSFTHFKSCSWCSCCSPGVQGFTIYALEVYCLAKAGQVLTG